ncbi:MAG TPA: adenylosuccinate lyase [Anaerolineaceae bacterium]|nr:adenylosuccinate lyase [Anaerolineaceae bacterium]HPN52510.1 adenylosuccinate lyase [Anaerolineaceae bacterium]
MTDYTNYLSPFSWRYATPAMRQLWSENHKRQLWRHIWTTLADVQSRHGLVTSAQVADIRAHTNDIDIPRALEIEEEIRHDLMAELKTFAAQCPLGGGALHLGATSMDIEDNADALRLREALDLVLADLRSLLLAFAEKMDAYADTPLMAFTHLQPAEPSTIGYRLTLYAQDLLEDWERLNAERQKVRGKGFKGAVGTAAAYMDLLGDETYPTFEDQMSAALDLPFYPAASQTYPRKQDYSILAALAGLGASLHKFAFDLRILQSPPVGEFAEPFGAKQVGSSAMPFKRNPINAEKIDSLARLLAQFPRTAWDNAANSLLERTLDDSANRRTLLPEAFLLCSELLNVSRRLVAGLQINHAAIQRNLAAYAPFAATESVLMALARAGADRQEMHEVLRELALQAWAAVQNGQPNPLLASLAADPRITAYLSPETIQDLTTHFTHTGIAPLRARQMARRIHSDFSE